MVTIGMNYKVLPGKEEVFEQYEKLIVERFKQKCGKQCELHIVTKS